MNAEHLFQIIQFEKALRQAEQERDQLRERVRELKEELDAIPCICEPPYYGPDKPNQDPQCPRCNWVDEDILKGVSE